MELIDLIQGLDIRPLNTAHVPARTQITDITEDSRAVIPGALFIARQGEKADGKAFIPQALHAGAAAILVDDPAFNSPSTQSTTVLHGPDLARLTAHLGERFFGSPSSKLDVLGVTGTNGKTTTTFLIHQLLSALGVRCGLIGTVIIDDGTRVQPASLTTPPRSNSPEPSPAWSAPAAKPSPWKSQATACIKAASPPSASRPASSPT